MNVELNVISKILQDSDIGYAVKKNLKDDVFIDMELKKAYKWLRSFYDKYGELPSLELFEEQFPNVQLINSREPIGYYVDKLYEQYAKSKLQDIMIDNAQTVMSKPLKALDNIKKDLSKLDMDSKATRDIVMAETVEERLKDYEKLSQGIDGMFTPWETLDDLTRGVHGGEVWSIVARPSIGKSWILCVFAESFRKQGKKVLLASEEMPEKQFARRMDALRYKLPYEDFRQGMLKEGDKARYYEGMRESAKDTNSIEITTLNSMSSIMAKAKECNADVVMVDGAYLLMDDLGGTSIWERSTNISRDLKKHANGVEIPIFATWQFNRSGDDTKDVSLANINTSDAVGQDADVVLGLVATKDMRINKERMIKVLKQREGELIDFYINFDVSNMNFSDLGEDDSVTIDDLDGGNELDF